MRFFLGFDGIQWISIPHLPDKVFENVVDVPVPFGRCFEKGKIPSLRQVGDCTELNFSFVDEIGLGPNYNYWDSLCIKIRCFVLRTEGSDMQRMNLFTVLPPLIR